MVFLLHPIKHLWNDVNKVKKRRKTLNWGTLFGYWRILKDSFTDLCSLMKSLLSGINSMFSVFRVHRTIDDYGRNFRGWAIFRNCLRGNLEESKSQGNSDKKGVSDSRGTKFVEHQRSSTPQKPLAKSSIFHQKWVPSLATCCLLNDFKGHRIWKPKFAHLSFVYSPLSKNLSANWIYWNIYFRFSKTKGLSKIFAMIAHQSQPVNVIYSQLRVTS